MKHLAALAVMLFLAIPFALAQENQGPDDQYVIIYILIQQGDSDLSAGNPQKALQDYTEARRELLRFQQVFSDWNPNIVNFRLNYLADKIAALTPASATNAPPVNVPPPPTPANWQSQLTTLNAQIRKLQGDNETLEAKLREALSAQPATVSADAFAQMQQQVRELTKENDLLKATIGTNAAPPSLNANPELPVELARETARANQLAAENQALQARVQKWAADASDTEALREENAFLKKELATVGSNPAPAQAGGLAQAQIEQLQSQATADWLEKTALENRIKQWQAASVDSAMSGSVSNQAGLESEVQELTMERDNLLAQLGEANKRLYGRRDRNVAAQVDALNQQVETLRARLQVDEAQPVPYTPQELALLQPEPLAANPNAEEKSIQDLPHGSAVLVAEAQSYFTNGDYDRAAADYRQILRRDPKNPLALGNLAAIELQQGKTADADKHIEAALAQQPDDAFNLTVLGRVKFEEGDNDAALDALSRAAKLDPRNPQIQNFLGVALAQKGLRVPAETAFRNAIEMDPNYGDAQKNLAIIYLSANPPAVELARWHYEKALAAGMPPNPALEKLLNKDSSPAPAQ